MRLGGVSYFTPEERKQLKRDDRLAEYGTNSLRLEDRREKETPGQRMASARERKNITQISLAKMLGVSKSTILRWESSETLFPWEKVRRVLPEIGPMPKDYPKK